MCRLGHVAPADHDGADDDEVFTDDGKIGSPAVGAEEAEVFVQREVPLGFARFAVDALEVAANTQRVDVARFRIGNDRRPTDTGVGHVRRPDAKSVFPKRLARVDVDADDLFTLFGSFRHVADDGVEPTSQRHGCAAAAEFFVLPFQ